MGWWACGGRAWGRRAGRSGPLEALEGHGQPCVRIFIDSALPAHAVGCSVRASCSTNFLLHEGMLVVCVRVRHFFTIAPPTGDHGNCLVMFLSVPNIISALVQLISTLKTMGCQEIFGLLSHE